MIGCDLPAKLAADAASRAGDEHHAVRQGLPNVVGFQLNLLPAKQVLNLNTPQLADPDLAEGQLVEGGNRFAHQTSLAQEANDLPDAFGRRGGHGDDSLLDVEFLADVHQFLRRAEDGNIMDAGMP